MPERLPALGSLEAWSVKDKFLIWAEAEGPIVTVGESFPVIFTVYEVAEIGLLLSRIKEFISPSELADIF